MTPTQRRAHLRIWIVLGPLTLVAVVALAALRPDRPIAAPPAAEAAP